MLGIGWLMLGIGWLTSIIQSLMSGIGLLTSENEFPVLETQSLRLAIEVRAFKIPAGLSQVIAFRPFKGDGTVV